MVGTDESLTQPCSLVAGESTTVGLRRPKLGLTQALPIGPHSSVPLLRELVKGAVSFGSQFRAVKPSCLYHNSVAEIECGRMQILRLLASDTVM